MSSGHVEIVARTYQDMFPFLDIHVHGPYPRYFRHFDNRDRIFKQIKTIIDIRLRKELNLHLVIVQDVNCTSDTYSLTLRFENLQELIVGKIIFSGWNPFANEDVA